VSKNLGFYRDGIRELREAGFDFVSADNGYTLRGDLSSGQKSAISRALESLESRDEEPRERASRVERDDDGDDFDGETPYYDVATESGDWDDIDWFDYDYADDFVDEEADSYDETPA